MGTVFASIVSFFLALFGIRKVAPIAREQSPTRLCVCVACRNLLEWEVSKEELPMHVRPFLPPERILDPRAVSLVNYEIRLIKSLDDVRERIRSLRAGQEVDGPCAPSSEVEDILQNFPGDVLGR